MSVLDAAAIAVIRAVTMIGDTFTDPDDDWTPVLLMFKAEGESVGLSGMAPLAEFMVNDSTKDLLADRALPALIHKVRPDVAAFISSSWMSRYRKDDPRIEQNIPPSQDPQRKEGVVVWIVDDIGGTRLLVAEIKRDGVHPPTLSDWDKEGNPTATSGRFVDSLREAMTSINRNDKGNWINDN